MIKISIIIPVYNVEKYIIRCLNSVARQSYLGEIECLLVDDCGPDNSAQICKDYIEKYFGSVDFKFIQREINGGLSAARNTGTEKATGDYIYYLDSDDELPINSMELLAEEVVRHPGVDVVMGFMLDDRKTEYYNLDVFRCHQYVTDSLWLQYHVFKEGKSIPVNGCNKLVRKGFILQNKLFFKEGIIHEDDHWMFYLVKSAKSWAFVFEPTYIRYWNEGSIMTSCNKSREEVSWIKIMTDHIENNYGPFQKLLLLRYLEKYFCQWMFLPRYPEGKKLYCLFFKSCWKLHMWKGVMLLTIWRLAFVFCDGFWTKKWLMEYSSRLFLEESNLWKNKYGVCVSNSVA